MIAKHRIDVSTSEFGIHPWIQAFKLCQLAIFFGKNNLILERFFGLFLPLKSNYFSPKKSSDFRDFKKSLKSHYFLRKKII